MFSITSVVHRSDYTYRGGYRYHYQPPRILPPVVYRPIPLSPPVTYYRPPVPVPPYLSRLKGSMAPQTHLIHKDLSLLVAHHPHHRLKGPFPYKLKGPCPTKPQPTLPPPPPSEPPVQQTLPVATEAPLTTITPAVETTAPVTLPVSTQSGFVTTVSAVETGRILPVRFALHPNQCSSILSKSGLFALRQR